MTLPIFPKPPQTLWLWFYSLWLPKPPDPLEVLEARDLYEARCALRDSLKEVEYHRAIVAAMQVRIARLTPLQPPQQKEQAQ